MYVTIATLQYCQGSLFFSVNFNNRNEHSGRSTDTRSSDSTVRIAGENKSIVRVSLSMLKGGGRKFELA